MLPIFSSPIRRTPPTLTRLSVTAVPVHRIQIIAPSSRSRLIGCLHSGRARDVAPCSITHSIPISLALPGLWLRVIPGMRISAWSTPASATFCRQLQAPCCACHTPIENLEEAVSIGIGVALVFAYAWPESEETPLEGVPNSSELKSGLGQIGARI